MKYLIVFLIVLSGLSANAAGKRYLYPEAMYQKKWCDSHGGIMEYRLSDKTRVDCLTYNLAVEFDFAHKWAECIGQSQYYSLKTKRQAACVLIMEHGEKDIKYLKRLRKVAYKKGIRTFTMKPEHICNPAVRSDCPHMQK